MTRRWSYSVKNLEEASDYAWDNQLILMVYGTTGSVLDIQVSPTEMDDMIRAKDAGVDVVDPGLFKNKDSFNEHIATTIIGG